MARDCLSKDEIKETAALLREVFTYQQQLRSRNPLAQRIQFPKIPPLLSESIVIHLIKDRKILQDVKNIADPTFGGRTADIIVRSKSGNLRVEVKATGQSAFEYFGPKDISADYIIWLQFGNFFTDLASDSITVFIIEQPSRYFKEPLKITLAKLRKVASVEEFQLSLNEF